MKNVLIITYYWPPLAGGGVQRWLKFSKYLPEFGWNPIIFTPENPSFNITDESLSEEISNNLEVIRFPIWEPYRLAEKKSKQGVVNDESKRNWKTSLLTWMRGNLLIPDPKVFWVNPSVKFLKKFIRDRDIEAVITTGPPHSMHLIGYKIKKRTGVTWVADFRDPWSKWDILQELKVSSLSLKYHRRLEKKVIRSADEVITVSRNWAKEFNNDYGRKVKVLTNGFDHTDFIELRSDLKTDDFTIIHAGLLNSFRNSDAFWKAIKSFRKSGNKVTVVLAGIIDDRIRRALIDDEILNEIVKFRDYIPHERLIAEYKKSSVLLLLTNNTSNQKGHLPGKLFEYLAVGNFILMLGNPDDEAAKIIKETSSGYCIKSNDEVGIKGIIELLFEKYKSHKRPETTDIDKYSRKTITSALANILDAL